MQESLTIFWNANQNHCKYFGMPESLKRFWKAKIFEKILEFNNHRKYM